MGFARQQSFDLATTGAEALASVFTVANERGLHTAQTERALRLFGGGDRGQWLVGEVSILSTTSGCRVEVCCSRRGQGSNRVDGLLVCASDADDARTLPFAWTGGARRLWLLLGAAHLRARQGAEGLRPLHALHGSTAVEAGATPRLVAAALGHASPAVTERHYLAPGTTGRATQRAALGVISGGKK
jgi:hypothetical protein